MINSVVLVGRLTKDPTLGKTTSGTSVTSFTIAVDDTRKGPNGEKQVIYIGVVAFTQTAENVAKYCRQGSLVGVVGKLTQRKYVNKANVQVTVTEILANQVEFLTPKGSKPAADPTGFVADTPAEEPTESQEEVVADNDVTNDDLPF